MQVRERAGELSALDATVVAVGFSPPEALAELADQLDWPWPFLSDTERVLYQRLELPSAERGQVWTPETKAIYRRAAAEGKRPQRPVEDTGQLGGDAVIARGDVSRVFRTRSPDDRTGVTELLAALAEERARSSSTHEA